MFEKEEHRLEQMKNHLNDIPIPKDIDQYILQGMERGKQKTKFRRDTRWVSYAASLLIVGMLLSIRFSPTVAAYVEKIPGMETIVQLIHYDKGLQLAAENDFIQPIGVSDEHDGIKFTVDGLIADESRLLIFYTIENKTISEGRISLDKIEITDGSGEKLKEYGLSWGSQGVMGKGKQSEKMDIHFSSNTTIPDRLTLNIKLKMPEAAERSRADKPAESPGHDEGIALEPTWTVQFQIDKGKFEGLKEVYDIHQTFDVEGQKITFEQMTVYPTRIALSVAYDKGNTKKILGFDDLEIVDDQGDVFGTISNGVFATQQDEFHETLYFQSNYFKKPKELYIRGSSLTALDKDKLEVVVDIENGTLLKKPDDRLTLLNVSEKYLEFQLKSDDPIDESKAYFVFSGDYKDASGNQYRFKESGSSLMEGMNEIRFGIENVEHQNPLILTIDQYPARIKGEFNIKVK